MEKLFHCYMDAVLSLQDQERMEMAKSLGGRAIIVERFGSGGLPVLLLGGVHGNESEGFLLAERFSLALRQRELTLDNGLSLYICSRLNPDGCAVLRRTNNRNVDLNRNLPTEDWTKEFTNVKYYPGASAASEAETRLCIELIQAIQPAMILSLHSYEHAMINYNGPCEDLAKAMSEKNGLPPKGDIGYPTPGSLGTWAGWERQIPTLTLELLRGKEPNALWEEEAEALQTALAYYLTHPRPQSSYK